MRKLIFIVCMLMGWSLPAQETLFAKMFQPKASSSIPVDYLYLDPPYSRPDLITAFLNSWANTNKMVAASNHIVTTVNQTENRDPFQGAVTLPNGTALLIPACSQYFGIVDQNGNYSQGAENPRNNNYAFWGGVYVSNLNVVVCVPYNTDSVYLYNVTNGTVSKGASHGYGFNKNAFNGGCLDRYGRVIMAPFRAGSVGIYDPVQNTWSNGPAAPADHCYSAASVMTNGLVIFTPAGYNNIGIYDPVANTLINGPLLAGNGWGVDNYQYLGGCNTIDGRIAMAGVGNHSNNRLVLLGPDTNTVNIVSVTKKSYGGCKLMPDGRILTWGENATVVNTGAMTYETGPALTIGTSTAYYPSDACLLPNGKIVITQEYISYPLVIYDCLAGRVNTNITLNCFVDR